MQVCSTVSVSLGFVFFVASNHAKIKNVRGSDAPALVVCDVMEILPRMSWIIEK